MRAISFCLVLAFAGQEVAMADPDLKPIVWNKGNDSAAWAKRILPVLPESVATIEDAWKAPASSKTLILIQDAHTNTSGQLNEARLLEILLSGNVSSPNALVGDQPLDSRQKTAGMTDLKYVFTEAGFGDESISFLKPYADSTKRKQTAEAYLYQARLKGSEYENLVSDRDFTLWGVDDLPLYVESVENYRAAAASRDRFEAYLDKALRTTETLKEKLFNPLLLSFDGKFEKFRRNELALTDYFGALSDEAQALQLSLDAYPHLKALQKLKTLESAIDFDKASREEAEAVASLSAEDQKALSANPSARKFSLDEKTQEAFFSLLEEKLAARAALYPNLCKYFDYRRKSRAIDVKSILGEEKALEAAIFKTLTSAPDEETLLRTSAYLESLKKLFDLTLTPDEFKEYEAHKGNFDIKKITGFLNRKLMDLRDHYDEALFLENGYEDTIQKCEEFYRLTYARDEKFIRNLTAKMDAERQATAVLITGGYHSPNLKYLLKQKGISFINLTPQVLHETNQRRYENLLLGQDLTKIPALMPAPSHVDVVGIVDAQKFGIRDDGARLATDLSPEAAAAWKENIANGRWYGESAPEPISIKRDGSKIQIRVNASSAGTQYDASPHPVATWKVLRWLFAAIWNAFNSRSFYENFFLSLKKRVPPRHLLLISSLWPQGLGDIVAVDEPLTQIIKRIYPNTKITLVVSRPELWEGRDPGFDIIDVKEFLKLSNPDQGVMLQRLESLKRQLDVDGAIDLSHRIYPKWNAVLQKLFPDFLVIMNTKKGILQTFNKKTFFLSRLWVPYDADAAFWKPAKGNIKQFMEQLMLRVTSRPADSPSSQFLVISDADREEVADMFRAGEKVLLLNLFSSIIGKDWRDEEGLAYFIGRVVQDKKMHVVFPEPLNDSQQEFIDRLMIRIPPQIRNQVTIYRPKKEGSLHGLKLLIHRADYIVTVDTGITHLSVALNKEPIVLMWKDPSKVRFLFNKSLAWLPSLRTLETANYVMASSKFKYSPDEILNKLEPNSSGVENGLSPEAAAWKRAVKGEALAITGARLATAPKNSFENQPENPKEAFDLLKKEISLFIQRLAGVKGFQAYKPFDKLPALKTELMMSFKKAFSDFKVGQYDEAIEGLNALIEKVKDLVRKAEVTRFEIYGKQMTAAHYRHAGEKLVGGSSEMIRYLKNKLQPFQAGEKLVDYAQSGTTVDVEKVEPDSLLVRRRGEQEKILMNDALRRFDRLTPDRPLQASGARLAEDPVGRFYADVGNGALSKIEGHFEKLKFAVEALDRLSEGLALLRNGPKQNARRRMQARIFRDVLKYNLEPLFTLDAGALDGLRVSDPEFTFKYSLYRNWLAGRRPVLSSDLKETLALFTPDTDVLFPGCVDAIREALTQGRFYLISGDKQGTLLDKYLIPAGFVRRGKDGILTPTDAAAQNVVWLPNTGMNRYGYDEASKTFVRQSLVPGINRADQAVIRGILADVTEEFKLKERFTESPHFRHEEGAGPGYIELRESPEDGDASIAFMVPGILKPESRGAFEKENRRLLKQIADRINERMKGRVSDPLIFAEVGGKTTVNIVTTNKGVALGMVRRNELRENEYLVFLGDQIQTGKIDASAMDAAEVGVQVGDVKDLAFKSRGLVIFSDVSAADGGAADYIRYASNVIRLSNFFLPLSAGARLAGTTLTVPLPLVEKAKLSWNDRLKILAFRRLGGDSVYAFAETNLGNAAPIVDRILSEAPWFGADWKILNWRKAWMSVWENEADRQTDLLKKEKMYYLALSYYLPVKRLIDDHGSMRYAFEEDADIQRIENKFYALYAQARLEDYRDLGRLPAIKTVSIPFGRSGPVPGVLIRPAGDARAPLPCVVFYHGLTGRKELPYLDALEKDFVRNGIAVLRVDLPRHGRYKKGIYGPQFLNRYSAAVRRYVHHLSKSGRFDDRRVGVFGFSFGGNVAIRTVFHRPGIYRAVLALVPPVYDTLRDEKVLKAYRTFLEYIFQEFDENLLLKKLADYSLDFDKLPSIDLSGLKVIAGSKDMTIHPRDVERIASVLAEHGGAYSRYDQGHYFAGEDLERANRDILDFFMQKFGMAQASAVSNSGARLATGALHDAAELTAIMSYLQKHPQDYFSAKEVAAVVRRDVDAVERDLEFLLSLDAIMAEGWGTTGISREFTLKPDGPLTDKDDVHLKDFLKTKIPASQIKWSKTDAETGKFRRREVLRTANELLDAAGRYFRFLYPSEFILLQRKRKVLQEDELKQPNLIMTAVEVGRLEEAAKKRLERWEADPDSSSLPMEARWLVAFVLSGGKTLEERPIRLYDWNRFVKAFSALDAPGRADVKRRLDDQIRLISNDRLQRRLRLLSSVSDFSTIAFQDTERLAGTTVLTEKTAVSAEESGPVEKAIRTAAAFLALVDATKSRSPVTLKEFGAYFRGHQKLKVSDSAVSAYLKTLVQAEWVKQTAIAALPAPRQKKWLEMKLDPKTLLYLPTPEGKKLAVTARAGGPSPEIFLANRLEGVSNLAPKESASADKRSLAAALGQIKSAGWWNGRTLIRINVDEDDYRTVRLNAEGRSYPKPKRDAEIEFLRRLGVLEAFGEEQQPTGYRVTEAYSSLSDEDVDKLLGLPAMNVDVAIGKINQRDALKSARRQIQEALGNPVGARLASRVVTREITVKLKNGVHASPSAILSGLVQSFSVDYRILINFERDDEKFFPFNMVDLLRRAIRQNETLKVSAKGNYDPAILNNALDKIEAALSSDKLTSKDYPGFVRRQFDAFEAFFKSAQGARLATASFSDYIDQAPAGREWRTEEKKTVAEMSVWLEGMVEIGRTSDTLTRAVSQLPPADEPETLLRSMALWDKSLKEEAWKRLEQGDFFLERSENTAVLKRNRARFDRTRYQYIELADEDSFDPRVPRLAVRRMFPEFLRPVIFYAESAWYWVQSKYYLPFETQTSFIREENEIRLFASLASSHRKLERAMGASGNKRAKTIESWLASKDGISVERLRLLYLARRRDESRHVRTRAAQALETLRLRPARKKAAPGASESKNESFVSTREILFSKGPVVSRVIAERFENAEAASRAELAVFQRYLESIGAAGPEEFEKEAAALEAGLETDGARRIAPRLTAIELQSRREDWLEAQLLTLESIDDLTSFNETAKPILQKAEAYGLGNLALEFILEKSRPLVADAKERILNSFDKFGFLSPEAIRWEIKDALALAREAGGEAFEAEVREKIERILLELVEGKKVAEKKERRVKPRIIKPRMAPLGPAAADAFPEESESSKERRQKVAEFKNRVLIGSRIILRSRSGRERAGVIEAYEPQARKVAHDSDIVDIRFDRPSNEAENGIERFNLYAIIDNLRLPVENGAPVSTKMRLLNLTDYYANGHPDSTTDKFTNKMKVFKDAIRAGDVGLAAIFRNQIYKMLYSRVRLLALKELKGVDLIVPAPNAADMTWLLAEPIGAELGGVPVQGGVLTEKDGSFQAESKWIKGKKVLVVEDLAGPSDSAMATALSGAKEVVVLAYGKTVSEAEEGSVGARLSTDYAPSVKIENVFRELERINVLSPAWLTRQSASRGELEPGVQKQRLILDKLMAKAQAELEMALKMKDEHNRSYYLLRSVRRLRAAEKWLEKMEKPAHGAGSSTADVLQRRLDGFIGVLNEELEPGPPGSKKETPAVPSETAVEMRINYFFPLVHHGEEFPFIQKVGSDGYVYFTLSVDRPLRREDVLVRVHSGHSGRYDQWRDTNAKMINMESSGDGRRFRFRARLTDQDDEYTIKVSFDAAHYHWQWLNYNIHVQRAWYDRPGGRILKGIVNVKADDLARLSGEEAAAKLKNALFINHHSRWDFEQVNYDIATDIKSGRMKGLLYQAQVDRKTVGYALLDADAASGTANLYAIGILTNWQRRGIGTELLDKVISDLWQKGMKTLTLAVDVRNSRSLAFMDSLAKDEDLRLIKRVSDEEFVHFTFGLDVGARLAGESGEHDVRYLDLAARRVDEALKKIDEAIAALGKPPKLEFIGRFGALGLVKSNLTSLRAAAASVGSEEDRVWKVQRELPNLEHYIHFVKGLSDGKLTPDEREYLIGDDGQLVMIRIAFESYVNGARLASTGSPMPIEEAMARMPYTPYWLDQAVGGQTPRQALLQSPELKGFIDKLGPLIEENKRHEILTLSHGVQSQSYRDAESILKNGFDWNRLSDAGNGKQVWTIVGSYPDERVNRTPSFEMRFEGQVLQNKVVRGLENSIIRFSQKQFPQFSRVGAHLDTVFSGYLYDLIMVMHGVDGIYSSQDLIYPVFLVKNLQAIKAIQLMSVAPNASVLESIARLNVLLSSAGYRIETVYADDPNASRAVDGVLYVSEETARPDALILLILTRLLPNTDAAAYPVKLGLLEDDLARLGIRQLYDPSGHHTLDTLVWMKWVMPETYRHFLEFVKGYVHDHGANALYIEPTADVIERFLKDPASPASRAVAMMNQQTLDIKWSGARLAAFKHRSEDEDQRLAGQIAAALGLEGKNYYHHRFDKAVYFNRTPIVLERWFSTESLIEGWAVKSYHPLSRDGRSFVFIRLGDLFLLDAALYARLPDAIRQTLGRNLIPVWDLAHSEVSHFALGPYTLSSLAALMNIPLKSKRLIDAGAGGGILSLAGSALGASPVVLIENNPDKAAEARRRLTEAGLREGADFTILEEDLRNTAKLADELSTEAHDSVVTSDIGYHWADYGTDNDASLGLLGTLERQNGQTISGYIGAGHRTPQDRETAYVGREQEKLRNLGFAAPFDEAFVNVPETHSRAYVNIAMRKSAARLAKPKENPQALLEEMKLILTRRRRRDFLGIFLLDPIFVVAALVSASWTREWSAGHMSFLYLIPAYNVTVISLYAMLYDLPEKNRADDERLAEIRRQLMGGSGARLAAGDVYGNPIVASDIAGFPRLEELLDLARKNDVAVIWRPLFGDPAYLLSLFNPNARQEYWNLIGEGKAISSKDQSHLRLFSQNGRREIIGMSLSEADLRFIASSNHKTFGELLEFLKLPADIRSIAVVFDQETAYFERPLITQRLLMEEIFHSIENPLSRNYRPVPMTEKNKIKSSVAEETNTFEQILFVPNRHIADYLKPGYSWVPDDQLEFYKQLRYRYLVEMGLDPNTGSIKEILRALRKDIEEDRALTINGRPIFILSGVTGNIYDHFVNPTIKNAALGYLDEVIQNEAFSLNTPVFASWDKKLTFEKESASGARLAGTSKPVSDQAADLSSDIYLIKNKPFDEAAVLMAGQIREIIRRFRPASGRAFEIIGSLAFDDSGNLENSAVSIGKIGRAVVTHDRLAYEMAAVEANHFVRMSIDFDKLGDPVNLAVYPQVITPTKEKKRRGYDDTVLFMERVLADMNFDTRRISVNGYLHDGPQKMPLFRAAQKADGEAHGARLPGRGKWRLNKRKDEKDRRKRLDEETAFSRIKSDLKSRVAGYESGSPLTEETLAAWTMDMSRWRKAVSRLRSIPQREARLVTIDTLKWEGRFLMRRAEVVRKLKQERFHEVDVYLALAIEAFEAAIRRGSGDPALGILHHAATQYKAANLYFEALAWHELSLVDSSLLSAAKNKLMAAGDALLGAERLMRELPHRFAGRIVRTENQINEIARLLDQMEAGEQSGARLASVEAEPLTEAAFIHYAARHENGLISVESLAEDFQLRPSDIKKILDEQIGLSGLQRKNRLIPSVVVPVVTVKESRRQRLAAILRFLEENGGEATLKEVAAALGMNPAAMTNKESVFGDTDADLFLEDINHNRAVYGHKPLRIVGAYSRQRVDYEQKLIHALERLNGMASAEELAEELAREKGVKKSPGRSTVDHARRLFDKMDWSRINAEREQRNDFRFYPTLVQNRTKKTWNRLLGDIERRAGVATPAEIALDLDMNESAVLHDLPDIPWEYINGVRSAKGLFPLKVFYRSSKGGVGRFKQSLEIRRTLKGINPRSDFYDLVKDINRFYIKKFGNNGYRSYRLITLPYLYGRLKPTLAEANQDVDGYQAALKKVQDILMAILDRVPQPSHKRIVKSDSLIPNPELINDYFQVQVIRAANISRSELKRLDAAGFTKNLEKVLASPLPVEESIYPIDSRFLPSVENGEEASIKGAAARLAPPSFETSLARLTSLFESKPVFAADFDAFVLGAQPEPGRMMAISLMNDKPAIFSFKPGKDLHSVDVYIGSRFFRSVKAERGRQDLIKATAQVSVADVVELLNDYNRHAAELADFSDQTPIEAYLYLDGYKNLGDLRDSVMRNELSALAGRRTPYAAIHLVGDDKMVKAASALLESLPLTPSRRRLFVESSQVRFPDASQVHVMTKSYLAANPWLRDDAKRRFVTLDDIHYDKARRTVDVVSFNPVFSLVDLIGAMHSVSKEDPAFRPAYRYFKDLTGFSLTEEDFLGLLQGDASLAARFALPPAIRAVDFIVGLHAWEMMARMSAQAA